MAGNEAATTEAGLSDYPRRQVQGYRGNHERILLNQGPYTPPMNFKCEYCYDRPTKLVVGA